MKKENLKIVNVPIDQIRLSEYNPRVWSEKAINDLTQSIKKYGIVDPIILNSAPNRKNICIGGHFRYKICQSLHYSVIPVVYVNIPDLKTEQELNIRLNKNTGEFDFSILKDFDESFLSTIGFDSEELDQIFDIDITPELFDLQKELKKLNINKIELEEGDIVEMDGSRLLVGDSTKEIDVLKLFGNEKADMVMTDPPYILNYLQGKRHGNPTEGFGAKKNRKYIGTDTLPENFTQLWMDNVVKIQKPDFSIIVYENWKNTKVIWEEMEKHWTIRNMIIWETPNRNQGYAAKHKFFSKYDIAMLGSSDNKELNLGKEEELLQNEHENALYATSGDAHWEGYKKNNKYCPTDIIRFNTADEKSSGQGIIFGVKPIEILIPYIKVLTKRDDLIFEPFGGSGSTLIAANKMKRRCYILEKCPIYAEVIKNRWEKAFNKKAKLIKGGKNAKK